MIRIIVCKIYFLIISYSTDTYLLPCAMKNMKHDLPLIVDIDYCPELLNCRRRCRRRNWIDTKTETNRPGGFI